MKYKLTAVLFALTNLCYAAQAPETNPALTEFKTFINELAPSKTPLVMEIYKNLNDYYQQAVQKDMNLGLLKSRIQETIAKLQTPTYKDIQFNSPIYGYITLGAFAGFLKDMQLLKPRLLPVTPAQAPLPSISIRPLKGASGVAVLNSELLNQFKDLVETIGDSSDPQVNEIKKSLQDLYKQTADKKIYITLLYTHLKSILTKMRENPAYKDKKVLNKTFGQEVTLSVLAETFDNLLSSLNKTISLVPVNQQKINYLKEIIDALPSGKNTTAEINDTRTQLLRLLDDVQNKRITLDSLVAQLYGIKEMLETTTSIKDIEFTSPKYGKFKIKPFSEIILGDLIEQIGKRDIVLPPSKGIFAELEEPQFAQPNKPLPATPQPITPAPSKPTTITPSAMNPTPQPNTARAPALKPLGLSNIGNSCFMNASLQNLMTFVELNNQLLSMGNRYKPNTFASEYLNFINLMRDKSTGTVEPKALCHRGWARMGFNPLTQQDNDEFINVLLDDLLGNPLDKNNQPLPLRNLLEIQTQTFLANKPSEPKPGSVLLSLPANCTNLDQCLKNFFAVEKVEYGKPLQPGGSLPIVDKQEKIVKSGKYLIIHLKRNTAKIDPRTQQPLFDNNDQMIMEKLSQPIPFPLTNLDLNPYALAGVKLPLYRLNGMVIHAGSARGGHYTGYVRYANQWYFVNDSQVSPVSPQQIEQIARQGFGSAPDQTPTTLFYEQQ